MAGIRWLGSAAMLAAILGGLGYFLSRQIVIAGAQATQYPVETYAIAIADNLRKTAYWPDFIVKPVGAAKSKSWNDRQVVCGYVKGYTRDTFDTFIPFFFDTVTKSSTVWPTGTNPRLANVRRFDRKMFHWSGCAAILNLPRPD